MHKWGLCSFMLKEQVGTGGRTDGCINWVIPLRLSQLPEYLVLTSTNMTPHLALQDLGALSCHADCSRLWRRGSFCQRHLSSFRTNSNIWARVVQAQTSELIVALETVARTELKLIWHLRLHHSARLQHNEGYGLKANFQQRILSILFGKIYIYSISLLI